MSQWAAPVVRELVRHIGDDRRGLDLLHRILADLDPELTPLIPPPPADQEPCQDDQESPDAHRRRLATAAGLKEADMHPMQKALF